MILCKSFFHMKYCQGRVFHQGGAVFCTVLLLKGNQRPQLARSWVDRITLGVI